MKYFLLTDLKSLLPIILPIAGVVLVIAALLIIFLVRRNKKPRISDADWFDALGGKENVVEHTKVGSRISLVLKDYDVVDETKLNELGVDSIIKMSNKITLVVKGDADSLYKLFN